MFRMMSILNGSPGVRTHSLVTLHSITMAQTSQTPNLEAQSTVTKKLSFWRANGLVKHLWRVGPDL